MTHPQKRTVMQWLRDIFPDAFPKPEPPLIMTEWGPTTEAYRLQAAVNMRRDPDVRAKVEALLVRQYGSKEAGLKESRRRYPEAYE